MVKDKLIVVPFKVPSKKLKKINKQIKNKQLKTRTQYFLQLIEQDLTDERLLSPSDFQHSVLTELLQLRKLNITTLHNIAGLIEKDYPKRGLRLSNELEIWEKNTEKNFNNIQRFYKKIKKSTKGHNIEDET